MAIKPSFNCESSISARDSAVAVTMVKSAKPFALSSAIDEACSVSAATRMLRIQHILLGAFDYAVKFAAALRTLISLIQEGWLLIAA